MNLDIFIAFSDNKIMKAYQIYMVDDKFPDTEFHYTITAQDESGLDQFKNAIDKANQLGFNIKITNIIESLIH